VNPVKRLVLLLILPVCLNAQLIDSMGIILKGRRTLDARLESRFSFINNSVVTVTGFRAGISFQRQLRMGAGLSWLSSRIPSTFQAIAPDGSTYDDEKFLKFLYLCLYTDFVFHKTKRWQLSVPIQLGTGASWFQRREDYHWGTRDRKYLMLLYEPGITVHFKLFKWLGLGTDVGYRFTLYNNREVAETLNSPTYAFKLLFWPEQLYFDLFPGSSLTRRFGPSQW
jgi:hypothetical protein